MPWNLPTPLPRVPQPGESTDWIAACDAMAALETAACGPYGLRTTYALPPELLNDEFPLAVRWSPETTFSSRGRGTPAGAHPGGVRQHEMKLFIFVALGRRAGRLEDLMRAAAWVPVAWDEAYANNRTLDGAVREVWLSGGKWVPSLAWGKINAVWQLYAGVLFTGLLRLRYMMEGA